MSIGKFLRKLQKSFRQLWRLSGKSLKSFINRLLASMLGRGGRRERQATAGFVLPTVAMVMLVVVLLTTAMVLRSFDRAKNASNFRVSEAVLNVSAPAVERAKAKIEALFSDPILPRSTPTETTLYNTMLTQPEKYRFGDEIALKLWDDFGNGKDDTYAPDTKVSSLDDGSADKLERSETLNTAWKFPVDTDNNGLFDSFTLYGIYFRTPPISGSSTTRPRSAIEARTPPMEDVAFTGNCEAAAGTSAGLVGSNGWYKVGSELRKSFYIYTATVPITVDPTKIFSLTGGTDSIFNPDKYEKYQGISGFAALEVQQDQGQIPLQYQSVWYEDDLVISPGPGLRLNGRVFTNSNLFVEQRSGDIQLYLISSPASCYFADENSKIIVGGELVNGDPTRDTVTAAPTVDLFNENMATGDTPTAKQITNGTNESVSNAASLVAYNNEAYVQRIDFLVRSAIAGALGNYEVDSSGKVTSMPKDPQEVQTRVKAELEANKGGLDASKVRRDKLEAYFRNRTRRVPFKEVGTGKNALMVGTTNYKETDVDDDGVADANSSVFPGKPFPPGEASAVDLRPPAQWMYPTDPADGKSPGSYTTLTLVPEQPGMTKPEVREEEDPLKENYLGDRILLGNNLPALWYKDGRFVGEEEPQEISGVNWTKPSGEGPRTRWTRVQRLDDLGSTDRDGLWEQAAAQEPENDLENLGGLRVVTGAGIYVTDVTDEEFLNENSFLPRPVLGVGVDDPPKLYGTVGTENNKVVWPDTMPMWEDTGSSTDDKPNGKPDQYYNIATKAGDKRGDLLMRATAVYHYAKEVDGDDFKDELPIACVSSYYDPTTRDTAKNRISSGSGSSWDDALIDPLSGLDDKRYDATVGRSNNGIVYPRPHDKKDRSMLGATLIGRLEQQASLVFPNGRVVNQALRTALEKLGKQELSLADNSAIDAEVCAIRIHFGEISPVSSPPIPHGAIYEQAFLDAQQIKAIHRDDEGSPLDETFSLNSGVDDGLKDSPAYDLPIEQRQPLEIRATVLNLEKLRTTTITPATGLKGPSTEFLLPNTGIIYATRNDALPDMSASGPDYATRLALSAVDFKLDPTRRPNAIMLVDGDRLDRKRSPENDYKEEEKGLILATNLPVYIQASEGEDGSTYGFNLHQTTSGAIQEEFETILNDSWSNFYSRNKLDPDFACRNDQPGCTTSGDLWRSATIISDAVTLLSDQFRFGYRVEGDYDLRSNAGGARVDKEGKSAANIIADFDTYGTPDEDPDRVRKQNGFFANNFVTSRDFDDSAYQSDPTKDPPSGYLPSSYFNNFVTPVQRRTKFHEYVMEICRKPMVELCTPEDWVVGPRDLKIKASELAIGTSEGSLLSGTTARPATNSADRRYPRRVAFLRNPSNRLILTYNSGKARPIPIGINSSGQVQWYPYRKVKLPLKDNKLDLVNGKMTEITPISESRPRTKSNTLWYTTRASDTTGASVRNYTMPDSSSSRLWYRQGEKDGLLTIPELSYEKDDAAAKGIAGVKYIIGTDPNEQPLLEPVLQLQKTKGNVSTSGSSDFKSIIPTTPVRETRWLQRPNASTFNIVAVAGQGPIRIDTANERTEFGGGLQNYVRTLENWADVELRVNGSFIQSKQNNYATGPQRSLSNNTKDLTGENALFYGQLQGYNTNNGSGSLEDSNLGTNPYYMPPKRRFSFDVGLMTQAPDLFAQQFTVEPASSPKEFLREVGRDDDWIEVLLCAGEASDLVGDSEATYSNFAVPDKKQRPSICQKDTTGYPANP